MRMPVLWAASVLVGLSAGAPDARQDPSRPLWWIESESHLVAVDQRAAVQADIDAGLNINRVVVTEGRIAITSLGAYTSRVAFKNSRREFWPEAGATSTISIVDAQSLAVLARRTVPFRPGWTTFVNPDTLVVVSAGQVSGNQEKEILPVVTILKAPAWEAQPPIVLQTQPIDVWALKGSTKVQMVTETFDKRPAEVVTVDAITGAVQHTPFADDVYFTVPSGDPALRYVVLKSSVVAVDGEGRVVGEPMTAGKTMVLFTRVPGSSRYLLGGTTGKASTLHVVDHGAIVKTLAVPEALERVVHGPKTARLYACGKSFAAIVDANTLAEVGRLSIPDAYVDAMLSPDETRLYVFEGSALSVINVNSGQTMGRIVLGGGMKKFLLGQQVTFVGGHFRRPPPEDKVSAVFTLAFDASGAHVVVYHASAKELAIVDTSTLALTQRIGVGAVDKTDVWRLPGGSRLLVLRDRHAMAVDVEKGAVTADREFPGGLVFLDQPSGLVFVKTLAKAMALRADTLEPGKDFGAESAATREMVEKEVGVAVHGPTRRFVLATAKGLWMYDFDLTEIGGLEGRTRLGRLFYTGPLAEDPATADELQ